MSDQKRTRDSDRDCLEVTLEFGHTSTLRDALEPVPGTATHDWEVWVKSPSDDRIESFLEKVVFTLSDTFKDPRRTVVSPPYKIQEIQEEGYGSFKLLIDLFFRAPKGERALVKASVDYDLALQPFKRAGEEDFQKTISIRRTETMQFATRDEEFRHRLLKGGALLSLEHIQAWLHSDSSSSEEEEEEEPRES